MVDYTDDWWSDKEAFWLESPPPNKIEYRIMRAQKVETEGSPGFQIQWKVYKIFDNWRERDRALITINKQHPSWRLRASEGNPYYERLGGYLPDKGINEDTE